MLFDMLASWPSWAKLLASQSSVYLVGPSQFCSQSSWLDQLGQLLAACYLALVGRLASHLSVYLASFATWLVVGCVLFDILAN